MVGEFDLFDGLRVLIYRHSNATGTPPKAIYMGRTTKRELFSDPVIKNFMGYRGSDASRPDFQGIPIYIVDEENYLAVG